MRKILSISYTLAVSLYNYYLRKMSENLITSTPQAIQGTLYREGLQYYLQRPVGDRYCLRMIDVHGQNINRSHIGRQFQASTINDPSVFVPEGYVCYCYQLREVKNES
jgi:hypothetical protein